MLERLALLVGECRRIKCKSSSYRFAGVPSAPDKIQELFFLEFGLLGGDVRTVEQDEPVAFDVPFYFFAGQLTTGAFQDLRR
jgi:hypothetical protein